MVASLMNNAFLSSLMFLLLIGSSHAITSSDIKTICEKNKKQSFCLTFLNSKSSSPNIQALAKTLIDRIQARGTQTLKRLQSVIDGGVDPQSKSAYETCFDEYKSTLAKLKVASEYIASGDAQGVNLRVSAVMDAASNCLDYVKSLASVDASVVSNCKRITNIGGVALAVSTMLPTTHSLI